MSRERRPLIRRSLTTRRDRDASNDDEQDTLAPYFVEAQRQIDDLLSEVTASIAYRLVKTRADG